MKVFTVGLDEKSLAKEHSPPEGVTVMPPSPMIAVEKKKKSSYKGYMMCLATVLVILLLALAISELAYSRARDESYLRLRWAELRHRMGLGMGCPECFNSQRVVPSLYRQNRVEPMPLQTAITETPKAEPKVESTTPPAPPAQPIEDTPQEPKPIDARFEFLRQILNKIREQAEKAGIDGTMRVSVIRIDPTDEEPISPLSNGFFGIQQSSFGSPFDFHTSRGSERMFGPWPSEDYNDNNDDFGRQVIDAFPNRVSNMKVPEIAAGSQQGMSLRAIGSGTPAFGNWGSPMVQSIGDWPLDNIQHWISDANLQNTQPVVQHQNGFETSNNQWSGLFQQGQPTYQWPSNDLQNLQSSNQWPSAGFQLPTQWSNNIFQQMQIPNQWSNGFPQAQQWPYVFQVPQFFPQPASVFQSSGQWQMVPDTNNLWQNQWSSPAGQWQNGIPLNGQGPSTLWSVPQTQQGITTGNSWQASLQGNNEWDVQRVNALGNAGQRENQNLQQLGQQWWTSDSQWNSNANQQQQQLPLVIHALSLNPPQTQQQPQLPLATPPPQQQQQSSVQQQPPQQPQQPIVPQPADAPAVQQRPQFTNLPWVQNGNQQNSAVNPVEPPIPPRPEQKTVVTTVDSSNEQHKLDAPQQTDVSPQQLFPQNFPSPQTAHPQPEFPSIPNLLDAQPQLPEVIPVVQSHPTLPAESKVAHAAEPQPNILSANAFQSPQPIEPVVNQPHPKLPIVDLPIMDTEVTNKQARPFVDSETFAEQHPLEQHEEKVDFPAVKFPVEPLNEAHKDEPLNPIFFQVDDPQQQQFGEGDVFSK